MILPDEAATERLGRQLAAVLKPGDVVALSGPLGVGKTALARAILYGAGHAGEVPSPTFAIVQPYDQLPLPIWHCDLYRLEAAPELDELGLDEVLTDGALLVEWPERAGAAAWPQALRLFLQFAADGARALTAQVPAAWKGRWPPPR
jgi:tRNA threonylcarbamoyladenosine biosynthesis protein TsaE